MPQGMVVKLDRGFPLVLMEDGTELRCEHATALKKSADMRAVIGDSVSVLLPSTHTMGQIAAIEPRRTSLVRKDPRDRATKQVLAANFDWVAVVHPVDRLNIRRLERELVLAFETGAQVAVILTKSDLMDDEEASTVEQNVRTLLDAHTPLFVITSSNDATLAGIRQLIDPVTTMVLMGQSGAGKSTLINNLIGHDARKTQSVREGDGKGRHTTVSREMLRVPEGGWIVDMPGVRGLGLWDAAQGISTAFADVEGLAQHCRFRDCKHHEEPGCALHAAVEQGSLSKQRLDSYLSLVEELEQTNQKREEARWSRKR